MASRDITVSNELGIHARPAAQFAALASRFACEITVSCDGRTANGKSIMSMMMLAACSKTQLRISAEGSDADTALDALVELVARGFGSFDVVAKDGER